MTSWADRKAQVRAAAHAAFAVRCLYSDRIATAPVELQARLHSKVLTGGNAGLGSGYAQIVEGVEKVIFDKRELDAKGVVLREKGNLSFPDYGSHFRLGVRDDTQGPINDTWSLAGA